VAGDQITCTFGSPTAVGQVDLRIEPGETFGLPGPMLLPRLAKG
jgi:ABC-type multidrug transport system ATPase subunit